MFKHIGLVSKQNDPRVADAIGQLQGALDAHAATLRPLWVDDEMAPDEDWQGCDLVMVIGGDGTLLGGARQAARFDIPVTGINLGHRGFLTDIPADGITRAVENLVEGKFQQEQRFLLALEVKRGAQTLDRAIALNDVVLHKSRVARLFSFETYVNGEFIYSQRSDGMIIATPTGSTAYAMSCGGPIIQPGIDAILLVPVNPHTLTNRPVVIAGDSTVEIRLADVSEPSVKVSCDGLEGARLQVGDSVQIRRLDQQVKLLHPADYDYFATLRSKLHWASA